MQIFRPHDFSAEIADALAQLRLWFVGVVAWLGEFAPLPREARLWLQCELRCTRREIRVMLTAAILARMRIRKRRRQTARPCGPERGFRWRSRRAQAVQVCTRGISLRTLADMRRVIDEFDAVVARAFAGFPDALKGGIMLMVCAPVCMCACDALARAAEAADTS